MNGRHLQNVSFARLVPVHGCDALRKHVMRFCDAEDLVCLSVILSRLGTFLASLGCNLIRRCTHHRECDRTTTDEGLTLETSAFKLFKVANLRYRLS